MSDSLPASAAAASAEADREARIEQLLLSGLDQYFAGQYQHAINIWTRVVFLERAHGRARAYIERARSAMAERQRECEELVHTGIDAYNAGDTSTARELLTRAVEQGGPSDTALMFLDRLSRVSVPESVSTPVGQLPRRSAPRLDSAVSTPPAQGWTPTVVVSALAAAAVLMATLALVSWFTEPGSPSGTQVERAMVEPLPVVRPSEIVLARARVLYADGHLRDALRTLDRIALADPLRGEADRLRVDVQHGLLDSAVAAAAPARSGVAQ